ncbi:unnamed protein product, partial [Didymodactylos carnosus]
SITVNSQSSESLASDEGEHSLLQKDQEQRENVQPQDSSLMLFHNYLKQQQQKRRRPLLGRSLETADDNNSHERRNKRPLMGRDIHNTFKNSKRTRPLMG